MSKVATILQKRAPWVSFVLLLAIALVQGGAPLRFGDGLELVAVSSHLGVAHPSGYPLFTLLLHTAQQAPLGEPYLAAIWLCRAAAVLCAFGLFLSIQAAFRSSQARPWVSASAALLFAAAFLWGTSLRATMHLVEVYGLNAALISGIVAMLVWAPGAETGVSTRRLLLACIFQGLALAHHLTSAALLPLVLYALWRHAREGTPSSDAHESSPSGRWIVAAVGAVLLIGLPLVLYGTLMARTPSEGGYGIAWGAPESPSALLRHLRGVEYGSSQFLMADPFTRFSFAGWWIFCMERIGQLVTSAGSVFMGSTALARLGGWLAVVLTVLGGVSWWRRTPRGGYLVALILALVMQLLFVVSYNIADIADYFLAIQVLCLPLVVVGLARAFEWFEQRRTKGPGPSVTPWILAVPVLLVILSVSTTTRSSRPSSVGLTDRYKERLLNALPEGAAVLTSQSADLFLLWYTRFSLEERTDLFVFPANMHDREWLRRSFPLGDPRRKAVSFSEQGIERLDRYVLELRSGVVDPLLENGRVFATISHVGVLEALAKHYSFRQTAQLMSPEEARLLAQDGRPGAPPILWELRRKTR